MFLIQKTVAGSRYWASIRYEFGWPSEWSWERLQDNATVLESVVKAKEAQFYINYVEKYEIEIVEL